MGGVGRIAGCRERRCRDLMSVYVVAQGRIENRKQLEAYVAKALPTIQAHGGRVLAFDETPEVVEGAVEYPRTVILEFSSREQFRGWYDSAEYQKSSSTASRVPAGHVQPRGRTRPARRRL
jgi:uncharacterized protein (DUF1330 family)